MRYWERQPIPVYAFLVLVNEWPPVLPKRLYTVRITEQIVHYGIPNQSMVRLRTSECADAETVDEDLRQFVTEVVPGDTAAMFLRRGIVAPVPDIQQLSEKRFIISYGVPYLQQIQDNIRDASIIGLFEALASETRNPERKMMRKRFEAVASLFEDELHVFGLSMLVRAAHVDGEIGKAKEYVHRALARIEADTSSNIAIKESHKDKLRELLKDFE